jgi:septum formation protein
MLILASGSPRRREILTMLGYTFKVSPADADETLEEGIAPDCAVAELSKRKAEAVGKLYPSDVVLGADTLVFCDGAILGKPENREDAASMLRLLSGRTHQVYTGVTVLNQTGSKTWVNRSNVTFLDLTEEEIRSYLETGEPMDKAGAYAVQGKGSALIESISGDFFAVMGLPASSTVRSLKEFGILPSRV